MLHYFMHTNGRKGETQGRMLFQKEATLSLSSTKLGENKKEKS